ncbi:hypothetical protein SAMN05216490_4366 [Mucilaginibacter mallensis]|uniref:DUF4393 domain-containing protein n=1 Tax=Mucilaginibacter mallensis TaxID=652787 RepID=A0A1H2BVU0_MUCMA|nr:hypothetical protein [Mucilaginibacter mallensis]SDT61866.1 hypothetical protein SAMN05216490_4366 [Mucilaginibacter mallensis]
MNPKTSPNNIQESFDRTLKHTNFQDITIDISEITIDSLLKDGILKDIPIVGTLIHLAKLGANVRDLLFLKKVISFMNGLRNIPPTERDKMINKINDSKEYKVKVGEKLLYIIDTCSDYENSENASHLFKAFLEEKITYDEFLRSANIIERITSYDLKWFLKNTREYMGVDEVNSLISSGLFDLHYEQIDVSVEDQDDYESSNRYKTHINGGETGVTISRVGKIILEVFGK